MNSKYKRWAIASTLTLTGCVTAAWAANNFGNTTITGTLTVVGNIIASGLSGLKSLTLTDTAGVPTLTMDGTSAGGTGVAYNSLHVKAKKTGGSAVDADELPLSITSDVWNGSTYVDGPKVDLLAGGVFLSSPDGSFFSVLDGGIVGTNSGFGAGGAISGASLTTTDGGLTMVNSIGGASISVDSSTGSSPMGQIPALTISAEVAGTNAGQIIFSGEQADADNWKIDLGNGGAWVDKDGFHAIAPILDGAQMTGLTDFVDLFGTDGSGFVDITEQGTGQFTKWVEASNFRANENTVITPAASIAIDCLNSGVFDVTADQNITIGAPSNFSDAQVIRIRWKQNGTGSWTPTWNSVYRFGSISNAPTATAGKVTIWTFLRNDVDSKWDAISVVTNL